MPSTPFVEENSIQPILSPVKHTDDSGEILALKQQLQTLKDLFKASQKGVTSASAKNGLSVEIQRYKHRIEKLTTALIERDQKIANLQKMEEKFAQAGDFFRQRQLEIQQHVLKMRDQLQLAHDETATLKEKVSNSEEELLRTQEALMNEIQLKHQTLDELSNLYTQFDILKKKFADANQKLLASEKAYQELTIEKDILIKKFEEQSLDIQKTEAGIAGLKIALDHSEKKYQSYYDSVALEQRIQQEEIIRAQVAKNDSEASLKIAHLHLAKKVKETSDLTDKTKTLELANQQLNNNYADAQHKILELNATLEDHCQNELAFQKQLEEVYHLKKANESQLEKRVSALEDKLLANEEVIKELKRTEEKYYKLQSLWNNVGGFFAEPSLPAHPVEKEINKEEKNVSIPVPIKENREKLSFTEQPKELHSDNGHSYNNLFDPSVPSQRFRNNLFD